MNPGGASPPAAWGPLLAGVLARSRLVVALIDADGVVAWSNEAAQALGLGAGARLSQVLDDRPAGGDDAPASALTALHDAVVAQRPLPGVDLPMRADPQRWWRVELQLLGDALPRPDGVRAAVALQEVTALRRAREAMGREAQLLREAAAIAGVGAWDLDLQDRRLRWSDEVRRIHDLPPESQPDLAAALAFYDDASREAVAAALERAIADGTPFDLVLSLHTAAGRRRWVRSLGNAQRAVGPDGHPGPVVRLAGVIQDVTERFAAGRALAELGDRMRLATQASGLGVWELRLAPECLVWDARTATLHGVPPDAQVDLTVWRASVEPADWPAVEAALRPLRDGRTGQVDLRYRVRGAPGGPRHLESLCRAVNDGGDRRLLGICLDTTERVQHAQAMLDKAAAERASQAKSEFLSRVSHELRTPLHGILGYAQWLASRADELPTWCRDAVTAVHHAGEHLLTLVDDTLDLGAIETGALRITPAPVALDDVVDEALTVTAALPQAAGLRLLPWPPGAPEVLADRTRLRQVLLNLLSNAVKYNRPGGRVRVDWRQQGAQVRIAVSDDGPGLPAHRRDELFQPFNRLGAEAGPVPGSGLGLAIARQLAEAMGGRIDAESATDVGTTLALWLPLATAPGADADADADAEGPPLTVLYVEDNPVNATLMREVIAVQAPHWRLVVSPDGEQGLCDAAALLPDVLLLDINLPGISGHEVLAGVRALPALAGAVCIAVSADAMPDEVQRALANGFDQYWTKPLDVPTLARRIAQAAGARRRPAA